MHVHSNRLINLSYAIARFLTLHSSLDQRRKSWTSGISFEGLEVLEKRIYLSAAAIQSTSVTPPTTVQIGGDGFVYTRYGNPQPAMPMHGQGGVALEGGGTDVDQAFQWMISRMGGKGDFLVLGAADSTDVVRGVDAFDYNPYIYNFGGTNSVATLTIPNRASASDPAVAKIIQSADAIFIQGGDQNEYLDWWKGTPVELALNQAISRGVPIGGTSAGTDVLGQFIYSAEFDSIRSTQAMANPFDPNMTFDQNFVAPSLLPFLNNTELDTHFENRDRIGRLATFLARVDTNGWSQNKAPRGIGINQETALLIAPNGQARVVGNADATRVLPGVDFLMTSGLPQVDQVGQPLTYSSIQVEHVSVGGSFNLANWSASFHVNNSTTTYSTLSVTKGLLTQTPVPMPGAVSQLAQVNGPSAAASTISASNSTTTVKAIASRAIAPLVANSNSTFSPTSFVDSINSTPNKVVSLRDAINAANNSTVSGAVTIDLKSGEYLLSLPQLGAEDGSSGNLIDRNTKHTLVIQGKGTTGPNATTIDARELNDRILQMLPGTTVVLQNLILIGGLATDDGVYGEGIARGGAILDQGQSLTLRNVWVVANQAQGATAMDAQGGGIYSAGGSLALYGSLVAMNTAAGGTGGSGTGANGGNAQGGGIYAAGGSVTLGNASNPDKIESNLATGGTGGSGVTSGVGGTGGIAQGGGIYVGGGAMTLTLSMSHATISSNLAKGGSGSTASSGTGGNGGAAQGAGLFVGAGSVSIHVNSSNDSFVSNRASGGGGTEGGTGGIAQGAGLYLGAGSLSLTSDIFLHNVALAGNGAGGGDAQGAGAFTNSGSVNLKNDLFSANTAVGGGATSGTLSGGVGQGGGLYSSGGSLNLSANTFQFNRAFGGSGGDDVSAPVGGLGGDAAGGGLYANNDSMTITSVRDTFVLNSATGGRGGNGMDGGDGGMASGGGAFFNAKSLSLKSDHINFNAVTGGIGGQAGPNGLGGSGGDGKGGGVFVTNDLAQFVVKMDNDEVAANSAKGGFGGGAVSGGVGGQGGEGLGGGLYLNQMQQIPKSNKIYANAVTGGLGGLAAKNGAAGLSQGPNVFETA